MTGFGYALAGLAKGVGYAGLEQAKAKRSATLQALRDKGLIERMEMQQDRLDERAEANRTHQTAEREAAQAFQLENTKPAKPIIQTIYTEDGREQKVIIDPNDPTKFTPIGGSKAPSGLELESDGKGGVRIATGGKRLSATGDKAVEEKILNVQEERLRLNSIRDSVKDEYLTWTGDLKNGANWLRAKIDPNSLSDEDRKNYTAYTQWKQNTLTNVNLTIQSLTGAAMGVDEAKRIMASLPGLEDDAIAFKAKLDGALAEIDKKLDLYARQRGETPPSAIEQDGTADTSKPLPADIVQRKVVGGKTYIQDKHGNWFEE
ncbi:hypothetical protein [Roseibium sp.]|uniref:hypothetical protein n=1 Tax=Roseibium sp. TaxID=1936156 RepID=UPI003B5234EB